MSLRSKRSRASVQLDPLTNYRRRRAVSCLVTKNYRLLISCVFKSLCWPRPSAKFILKISYVVYIVLTATIMARNNVVEVAAEVV
ncbi:Hypothetical predicted protein [Scomber scombrus]|uniref:Uncharacterized protein n=1 Tax=Scomber scombrus TaxID=13677 RepID=A0AAV1NB35_SCOSC